MLAYRVYQSLPDIGSVLIEALASYQQDLAPVDEPRERAVH